MRRKAIAKSDGGQRLLGIPNVIERLIQQAIVRVLTPIFDPHFSESSFGFRPQRSAHGAAKQVQRIMRRGLPFVRYADDFAIFAKSRRAADRIMTSVSRYLIGTLRLVVNQEKSRVVASTEFEFLGFAFIKSRATINVAPKSVRKFKQRIRETTGRSRGISMERRLA